MELIRHCYGKRRQSNGKFRHCPDHLRQGCRNVPEHAVSMPEDAVTVPLTPAKQEKDNYQGKNMKESEYLKEIHSELSAVFDEMVKNFDFADWGEKLDEYMAMCGVPSVDVDGMGEVESLIATAFFLDGWIKSRLALAKDKRLKNYPAGTHFSHVFKEVPIKSKKEKAKK